MELYTRTLDIFLVQKALGHSSISSTMIYLEFASSEKEHLILKGRKGLPKFPPRSPKIKAPISRSL
jgi:integrase